MRKDKFCYEHSKNRKESIPKWKNKRTSNSEHRRKGFNPIKSLEIILRISLRIIIKEQILKVKHKKTLHHQKENTCL